MVFVWDPKKRLSNIRKHGIDFRDANRVFDGLTITAADRRGCYDEERFLTLGLLGAKVVCIAHTERDDQVRIISIREATRYETQRYFEEIGTQS
ncbi:MAG: hypothetical protein RL580_295 [Pseudomonadota bacterium]